MMPNASKKGNTLISPAILTALSHLLTQSVESLQRGDELPSSHAWSEFTLAPLNPTFAPRTHYTATVLKNIHDYKIKNGIAVSEMDGQGKSRSKKKKQKTANDTESNQDHKDDHSTPNVPSSEIGSSSSPSSSSNTLVPPSASDSSSSSSSSPISAYDWASLIGARLIELIDSDAGSTLRSIADVIVDVPTPDSSVRGGGFIDFTIKPKQATTEAIALSSTLTSTSSTHAVSSPIDIDGESESHSSDPASSQLPTTFEFRSIGTIESVFKLKYGTPRQGTIAPTSRGCLTLDASIPVESLFGLEEYSHIWLVFIFHRNENKKFRPKIEPPRAGGKKLGVFATRTPHRVNPIGLSLVKLDRIEGRTLYLSSLDLIQGTPIIDIKPYHPADVMPNASVPEWMRIQSEVKPPFEVEFLPTAETALQSMIGRLEFYHTFADARQAIEESVALDPRPIYVRTRSAKDEVYGYRLDRMNVLYRVDDDAKKVEVCQVEYVDYEAILASKDATDQSSGSSSSSKSTRHPTTSHEEEFITKKFLQQRTKEQFLQKEKQAATDAAAATSSAPSSSTDVAMEDSNNSINQANC